MHPPSDDLLRLYFLAECRDLGVQAHESGEQVVITYRYDAVLQKKVNALLQKYVGFWKSIAIVRDIDQQTGQVRAEIPFHLLTGQDLTPQQLEEVAENVSGQINADLTQKEKREDDIGPDGLTARQRGVLQELPEDERPAHAQLFRIGNVAVRYHQARETGFHPTEEDWREWLAGLPPRIRPMMEAEGFEVAQRALPFRRYYLERRDVGMEEYMERNLSPTDYASWRESSNPS